MMIAGLPRHTPRRFLFRFFVPLSSPFVSLPFVFSFLPSSYLPTFL